MDDMPDWFEPVAWRGVIFVLYVLWASNFAAAKLVMAEPEVDSFLYTVVRFGVAAVVLAPGALGAVKRANLDARKQSKELCNADPGSLLDTWDRWSAY